MLAPFTESQAFTIKKANTFRARLLGLMFKKSMAPNEALLIEPCNSVHTCWMRFPIDVLFMDANGCILEIRENVQPFRLVWNRRARAVLEINAKHARQQGLTVGSVIL